jgi:hypothetical protein
MSKFLLWLTDRALERTTYDGIILILVGLVILFFQSIASLVAYAAIAYGAWTLLKKEKKANE